MRLLTQFSMSVALKLHRTCSINIGAADRYKTRVCRLSHSKYVIIMHTNYYPVSAEKRIFFSFLPPPLSLALSVSFFHFHETERFRHEPSQN